MINKNVSKVAKGAVIVAGGIALGNLAMSQSADVQNLAVSLRAAEGIMGGLFAVGGTVKGGIMISAGLIGMLRGREKATASLSDLQRREVTTHLPMHGLKLKHH